MIPPRSKRCHKEQEEFQPGGEYYSLLEPENEGYKRSDFCPTCWNKRTLQHQKIFWKSRIPTKTPPPTIQRDQDALSFLKNLIQSNQEEAQAFILALLLTRNRLLRCVNEIWENGKIFSLYEVIETEEILSVKKITLSHTQIEEVRKALANKFF